MNSKQKIASIVAVIVFALLAIYVAVAGPKMASAPQSTDEQISSTTSGYPSSMMDASGSMMTASGSMPMKPVAAAYSCASGKSIAAVYVPNQVHVTLGDGRAYDLPQTVAASGARYANNDESVVFWNKGTGAFIQEKGITTYSDCSESLRRGN